MDKKRVIIYSLSFLLPLFALLLICCFQGIYPFGNALFLHFDNEFETLNYLAFFKSLYSEHHNFFYSLSKSGGSGLLDFNLFYGMYNPINFFLFLFPNDKLDIGLQWLTLIKMSLAGFTFNYFINRIYPLSKKSLIVSSSYALSGYLLGHITNIIFFDGYILLPLMILGIIKIIKEKKAGLFLGISLASMVCNAFTCYISLLFSFMFFFYYLLSQYNLKEQKAEIISAIKKYFTSLGIFLLLTAVLYIPVIYTLFESKFAISLKPVDNFYINPLLLLSRFFTGCVEYNYSDYNVPYVFCGIFIFFMVILYFYNQNISLKKRLCSLVFLTFIFSCFFLQPLHNMWNLFVSMPYGFIYRYGFIFTFLFLYISYEEIINFKYSDKTKIIIPMVFIASGAYLLIVQNELYKINSFLVLDIILSLLFGALLFGVLKYPKYTKPLFITIIILHIFNLTLNTYHFISVGKYNSQIRADSFYRYYKTYKTAFDYIKNNDTSLYRINSNDTYLALSKSWAAKHNNMPMLFNYSGFEHYGSLGKIFYKNFLMNLGLETNVHNQYVTYYDDNMPMFSDMFFGIKYFVTSDKNFIKPYEVYKTFENTYNQKITVYKNPYALPFAFPVNGSISEIKELKDLTLGEVYNKLAQSILPQNTIYFSEEKINPRLSKETFFYVMPYSSLITTLLQIKKGGNYCISLSETDKPLLVSRLVFDEKKTLWEQESNENLFNVVCQKGEKQDSEHIVSLLLNEELPNTLEFSVLYENEEGIKKLYEHITKSKSDWKQISPSSFEGTVETEEDNQILLFTLPYEEDWKIKINGEKAEKTKVLNALLGVPLSKQGTYKIQIYYCPRGLNLGILVSLIGLIILMVLIRKKEL
ncbi:YfhO family protein [bacterium]|nr:YfhO family protein [bacterium]